MEVIAFGCLKGGVGKSSVAGAMAAGLSLKGYRTLLIDTDQQCNTSYSMGAKSSGATVLGVLVGEVNAEDAIQHTENGDIIAASKYLAGAEAVITGTGKEYKLKEALRRLQGLYDYVLLDTSPTLGITVVNALTAADKLVIVTTPDAFSLQGIGELYEAVIPVKKYTNPSLKISGIVLNRFSSRSCLSKEVAELAEGVAAKMGTKIFKSTIRESITVREAQAARKNLFRYAPKSKVAADYLALVNEFLEEE